METYLPFPVLLPHFVAAPRRSGLLGDDMITEDIDISWKLQLNQWTIFLRATGAVLDINA